MVTDMIGEGLSGATTDEVGEVSAVLPVVERVSPSGTVYAMLSVEVSGVVGRAVDVTLSEEVLVTGLGIGLVVLMPAVVGV